MNKNGKKINKKMFNKMHRKFCFILILVILNVTPVFSSPPCFPGMGAPLDFYLPIPYKSKYFTINFL